LLGLSLEVLVEGDSDLRSLPASAACQPSPVQNPKALGRIVHCASYGGPYAGSFIPMLASVARAARDYGYETTICFSEVAQGRPWLGEVSDLADIRFFKPSGTRTDLLRLREILDETSGQPTVLHTHFGMWNEPAALLGLQRRHTAVLWHAHSASARRNRLRSKAYGAVFGRLVNGILCVSPEIYEDALARCVPPRKLRQLPNAVDLERFGPVAPGERDAARRRLGLSSDARIVLHFGWDWHRKGGDLLLAAADRMASSEPEVEFLTVLGETTGEALRDLLERHPTVRSLAPHARVNELYASADVFLNCSRAEGMPYSVLEALARGLPVVATDLPGQRDVLDGLRGAEVVSPESAAIATALREVLGLAPAERAEHASAARARVAASYGLGPWSSTLVALYAEALASGRLL